MDTKIPVSINIYKKIYYVLNYFKMSNIQIQLRLIIQKKHNFRNIF